MSGIEIISNSEVTEILSESILNGVVYVRTSPNIIEVDGANVIVEAPASSKIIEVSSYVFVDDSSVQRIRIYAEGALVAARSIINLIMGRGTNISAADNSSDNRVDITITDRSSTIIAQTTSLTLTDALSGNEYSNEGATALVTFLENASAGSIFTFYVVDADGIRITAGGTRTIQQGSLITSAGGYIESSMIGSSVTIKKVTSNQILVKDSTGQWEFN